MQQLERLFGFRIDLNESLDPVRMDVLKDRAAKIVAREDFDPEQFHLYFHQFTLTLDNAHFSRRSNIKDRIEEIRLTFSRNPKQNRKGDIKFFNYLLENTESEEVPTSTSEASVTYFLSGAYLARKLGFRNELVTFISKDLRKDHRKIKVSIRAYPTSSYKKRLRKLKDEYITKLDILYERYTPISQTPRQDTTISFEVSRTANLTKAEIDRLVEIFAGQAAIGGDSDRYFLDLVSRASLPKRLELDAHRLRHGDPLKDSRQLVKWAWEKGVPEEKPERTTLGWLLGELMEDVGLSDKRFIAALVIVNRLYASGNELDGLWRRYQIPYAATQLPKAHSDVGPRFSWSGPTSQSELQSLFRPEPIFQDVGFLVRCIERSSSVCRIEIPKRHRQGTGFLLHRDLVLTNYHVLNSDSGSEDIEENARDAVLHFGKITNKENQELPGQAFRLSSDHPIQAASPTNELDFVLLRVEPAITNAKDIEPTPWDLDLPRKGTGLNILQHPSPSESGEGPGMKVSMSSNGVAEVDPNRGLIQYVTRTAGGSSGSPCFNDKWRVVALHHAETSTTFGTIREGILFKSIYGHVKQLLK